MLDRNLETAFDPNARLWRTLQESAAEQTRQHCRTREAVAESADELKRLLSAHRSEQYHHFYRMERDLADLTAILREQLAQKDARIADLEAQLRDAQELLLRQHALLAVPSAVSWPQGAAEQTPLSAFTSTPESEPPLGEKAPIKLPVLDNSVASIAQLVMTSAETVRTTYSETQEAEGDREPTARMDAATLAAGHAKLNGHTKRGPLRLPRLRLTR